MISRRQQRGSAEHTARQRATGQPAAKFRPSDRPPTLGPTVCIVVLLLFNQRIVASVNVAAALSGASGKLRDLFFNESRVPLAIAPRQAYYRFGKGDGNL